MIRLFCSHIFLVLISLTFLPPLLSAQPIPAEKPPIITIDCLDVEAPGERLKCAQARKEQAQDLLNRWFERLSGEINTSQPLTSAQNNWITYRNNHCNLTAEQEQNEALRQSVEMMCIARLSETRLQEIMILLQQIKARSDQIDEAPEPDRTADSDTGESG